jgi:peroxiredoxin
MMELEALQGIDRDVRALGARMLAVSPELERYGKSVHRKLNLTYDVLADPHLRTAERFGLVYVFPDYLRELYRSFGSTLDRFNDEPEYRLPLTARYVLDTAGTIRAAEVSADYTVRPDPSDTLEALKRLTGRYAGAA